MTTHIRPASEGNGAPQGGGPLRERFDYTPLAPEVAHQVQTAAQRIQQVLTQTVATLIAVGNELLAVKEALPHGSFGPWLQAEFGWTERTARRFMNVARRFGSKTDTVSVLGIEPTAAYLLAAPSAPCTAVQEAVRRAEGGERITPAVARELIDAHRAGHRSGAVPPAPTTNKLMGELLTLLEAIRGRWDREQYPVLARQLKDFADSLGEE